GPRPSPPAGASPPHDARCRRARVRNVRHRKLRRRLHQSLRPARSRTPAATSSVTSPTSRTRAPRPTRRSFRRRSRCRWSPQNINAKFDEALRYSAGVFGSTFGNDTRQDWFQIRGFQSQDVSTFLDGLQLFSFAFGTWKLQPFSLDRIEILRGPSAILYGGSG